VQVFVTGASGYLGRALTAALLQRGHRVHSLVRSSARPVAGVCVTGNALDATSYQDHIAPCDTLVHLVGVPHPAPWKARQFRAVDLVSAQAAIAAARAARVRHFVYVSVAQPAPVMRAYLAVRAEVERQLARESMAVTVLRPWYVLGPGHRWACIMQPAYAFMERIAATREMAQRLGLLRLDQMVTAMVWTMEHPAPGMRVFDVPGIRKLAAA
jgi:nucleoside-diphosphate-sugar epimerase